jgi:hypothetical protein
MSELTITDREPLPAWVLRSLFELITGVEHQPIADSFQRHVARLVAAGDPETVVYAVDLADRLESYLGEPGMTSVTARRIATALGWNVGTFHDRPRRGAKSSMACEGWRLVDYTAILFDLANFGIPVDPTPLREMLLPTIPKKGVITRAELHVLWDDQEYLKSDRSIPGERGEEHYRAIGRATNGCKLTLSIESSESRLCSRGPKYRPARLAA